MLGSGNFLSVGGRFATNKLATSCQQVVDLSVSGVVQLVVQLVRVVESGHYVTTSLLLHYSLPRPACESNDVIHHRHFIHIRQMVTRQCVSFCWQYNFV